MFKKKGVFDMLLNFEVENWACFRDPVCFTMQAGAERNTTDHLIKVGSKSRPLKILPIAAIYGNNASGKTQFISALSFLKNLVLGEYKTGHFPLQPFLLDDECRQKPTHFVLQFVVTDVVYELDVLLKDTEILNETLSRYNTRNTSKTIIYKRDGQKVSTCTWGGSAYCKYVETLSVDPTRLFLTLSAIFASNEDSCVATVYNWFANSLVVITPTSHYSGFDDYCCGGMITQKTLNYLERFDTGISRLESESVPLTSFNPIIVDEIRNLLKPGLCHRRLLGNELYVFTFDDSGDLIAKRLVAFHTTSTGDEFPFPMPYESDGTRRMLDFIPIIAQLTDPKQQMVFVVDEINNRLHHLVTRALIEDFIMTCNADSRKQLIFTTHDLLLMDQNISRRDEMWVTDKAPDGHAILSDLSAFENLRKDSKIRDIYLDGRLGGVPRHI